MLWAAQPGVPPLTTALAVPAGGKAVEPPIHVKKCEKYPDGIITKGAPPPNRAAACSALRERRHGRAGALQLPIP